MVVRRPGSTVWRMVNTETRQLGGAAATAVTGICDAAWPSSCGQSRISGYHGHTPTVHDRHSAPSSTALSSGAEGRNADAACGAPDGYQPSTKYCRTSARLPATTGAAMDVPRCIASAHVCAPSGLHQNQGLAHTRTLPDQRQATRHERWRHEHAALHHQAHDCVPSGLQRF